jgi:hypothetical protein
MPALGTDPKLKVGLDKYKLSEKAAKKVKTKLKKKKKASA